MLDICPEDWNNIPYCLVSAIKLLISDALASEEKLANFTSKVETKVKKLNNNLLRIEKDLTKKEHVLATKIETNNSSLTDAFIQQKKQIDDTLNKQIFRSDEMQANIKNTVRHFFLPFVDAPPRY